MITSWFLSALIASTAYGGNLRAFLMTPEKEKPIDDLAGLTQSGLTWNMVLYGETVERDMERSQVGGKRIREHEKAIFGHFFKKTIFFHQDPVIRQIWDEKEVVEYQLFPFERVTHCCIFFFKTFKIQIFYPADPCLRGRLCHDRVVRPSRDDHGRRVHPAERGKLGSCSKDFRSTSARVFHLVKKVGFFS